MMMKRSLLAALVAVITVAATADTSHAFFGLFRGGSHGGWGSGGSWGSHGGWGYGSSGSYGGWGSHGGAWGSHGGGWSSHGGWGSGGGWSSHGSHGSHGSWGSHGGGYAGYAPEGYYARRGVMRGRVYAARPTQERVIASAPAVKTNLTLHVPAEAKVTLAGVETKQSGETRQFATTRLRSGEAWDDYTVVVELEQAGQIVREERTISLVGGQSQELTISFDSSQVAQR